MQFEFPKNQTSIIKVIGVGGGGGNAVNNMYKTGIDGVDFIVCNTDVQDLKRSPVPAKIRLGVAQTEGLGAGMNPEVGKKAAMESIEEMRTILKENARMVFITAGMGGGTGTGAAPVVAGMAKEMGILTVGIVTIPFKFEGPRRMQQALDGITEFQKSVDTLIVIDNNNLLKMLGQKVNMMQAFREADLVLCNAAKGIAEIITSEGYVNVDFADVCTTMRDGGKALMGTAMASGEGRALKATEAAINSPLLDNEGIAGARALIVNITASMETLEMDETTEIIEHIQNAAGMDANIIYGIVYDDNLGDELRVTVIATRYDGSQNTVRPALQNAQAQPVQQPQVVEQPVVEPIVSEKVQDDYKKQSYHEESETSLTPEEREILRRLNQKEREDRLRKLNTKTYDIHDPESLQQLENVPAWERRRVRLEDKNPRNTNQVTFSRLSMEEDNEQKFKLRDQNAFLHDNVD